MKYIDIHCHLDSEDYDSDRAEVLVRMKERELAAITIGADLDSSRKAVEIAEQNENIWACIGVHPNYLSEVSKEAKLSSFDIKEEFESELLELVKSPKVVAIGECGLDYFRMDDEKQKVFQKELFEKQIKFAIKHNKALMLHVRDERSSQKAYEDVAYILNDYKKEAVENLFGNVHFFAGGIEQAKKFLDLGFTVSFTGVVTFTRDYDEVIKYIPSSSIMSETDAPWVAPIPFRGKRNEPSYVVETVKRLAEIRGESEGELNQAILKNAERVFGIA